MNIGEKIKQLCTDKNLTQPQLAEAIGIEQSYLSKLENDKSVPSADIFQAILKALAVDVGSFLEGIDDNIIHRQLRQIPEVANYLQVGVAYKIHNIKKWLFGSAAACVIGSTLIVAGQVGLIFSDKLYNYQSKGIVLPNEAIDIFDQYKNLMATQWMAKKITLEESNQKIYEFETNRLRPDILSLRSYEGQILKRDVEGGIRYYSLNRTEVFQRPENRYITLIGVLLTFSGLFGFFVEFRLRKI